MPSLCSLERLCQAGFVGAYLIHQQGRPVEARIYLTPSHPLILKSQEATLGVIRVILSEDLLWGTGQGTLSHPDRCIYIQLDPASSMHLDSSSVTVNKVQLALQDQTLIFQSKYTQDYDRFLRSQIDSIQQLLELEPKAKCCEPGPYVYISPMHDPCLMYRGTPSSTIAASSVQRATLHV